MSHRPDRFALAIVLCFADACSQPIARGADAQSVDASRSDVLVATDGPVTDRDTVTGSDVASSDATNPSDATDAHPHGRTYPLHTGIVSTTFWVGEIFDPTASDGSQVYSTYDSHWETHYGGCDGVMNGTRCDTEARTAANGYFPLHMTPHENPFYLDLPFDDVNDPAAFARRASVIPWADDPGYAGHATDTAFSYMKNRWVRLALHVRVCYAQIEDAGPAQYDDAEYVFGTDDRRPASHAFHGAGMDVSPAVNGCLGYAELDGQDDRVDWQFVDDVDVPDGPWRTSVTTSAVDE